MLSLDLALAKINPCPLAKAKKYLHYYPLAKANGNEKISYLMQFVIPHPSKHFAITRKRCIFAP